MSGIYIGASPDEIFLGNTFSAVGIPKHLRGLKTIRLGDQALDIYGNKLDREEVLPMFIHKSEIANYGRIQMGRFQRICAGMLKE